MDALTVATAFSLLSLVLLVALTGIWVQNYREFGTPMILGLIVFAVVLAIENGAAIYFFFFSMDMLYAEGVHRAVATLRGLQFLALSFLTWATVQ